MKTPEEIKSYLGKELPIHHHKGEYESRLTPLKELELEAMHAEALNYIQQLEAKLPRWISVEERLPEKKQRVMVYTTQGAYRLGAFSFVGKEGAVWFKCDKSCISCTHWMPLPDVPKEE